MASTPKITKIEIEGFSWDVKGMAFVLHKASYDPDSTATRYGGGIKIYADNGAVGEHAGWNVDLRTVAEAAEGYIGTNPLDREQHYQRGKNGPAMAVFDIALWDLLGKMTDLPVYSLLGGYRKKVPAYASTIDGAVKGPLSNPETYADFAQQCLEMGYKAFKIHPFVWPDVQTHIDAVLALGDRVGGKMDLMLDSFNWYQTFADALKVGRACDEAGFFWWEDPYQDGGVSQFAHRKLRQMVQTPMLQTEHIRLLEQHVDFIVADATDYVRAGAHEDGGVTGAMKIAHASEGFGLDVELHGPGPVHRHIMSSIRNTNFFELGLVHPKVKTTKAPVYLGYNDDLDGIDSEGNVYAPDGPGIGVPLDWDWIRAHQVDEGVLAEA